MKHALIFWPVALIYSIMGILLVTASLVRFDASQKAQAYGPQISYVSDVVLRKIISEAETRTISEAPKVIRKYKQSGPTPKKSVSTTQSTELNEKSKKTADPIEIPAIKPPERRNPLPPEQKRKERVQVKTVRTPIPTRLDRSKLKKKIRITAKKTIKKTVQPRKKVQTKQRPKQRQRVASAPRYSNKVSSRINRYKFYPLEARRDRLEGVARVVVRISPSGRVLSVRLAKSSGHIILDRAALRSVRAAAPYPSFSTRSRSQSVTASVSYYVQD